MHDIVKAVGNCSYNQLVEKIISCKQSDNSELAGEGEYFVFTLSIFWSAWLPSCLPLCLFSLTLHLCTSTTLIQRHLHYMSYVYWTAQVDKTKTYVWLFIKWPTSTTHSFRTVPAVSDFSTKNIVDSTLSFLNSSLLGCCQVNTLMPQSMIKLVSDICFFLLCFCICIIEIIDLSGLMWCYASPCE